MLRRGDPASAAQVLVFAFGGRQVERLCQPDRRGNRFVDQRVERRGADVCEHRVALVRRRSDVPPAQTSRVASRRVHLRRGAPGTAALSSSDSLVAGFDRPSLIIQSSCGLLVDRFGVVLEGGVHLDDFAAHRREQLGHRLDRLDRAERLAGRDRAADVRQLHEDDVAELLLRVVGDADLGGVAGRRGSTRGPSCTSGQPDTPSHVARLVERQR